DTQRTDAANLGVRSTCRPALARHVRLSFDRVREQDILLGPESVTTLNPTGAAVLRLCDGRRTTGEVLCELRQQYDGVADAEVCEFLARLVASGRVELHDEQAHDEQAHNEQAHND